MAATQPTLFDNSPQVRWAGWSKTNDDQIRELYPTHTINQMAAITGRTINAVRNRCSFLKLSTKCLRWTDRDIDILRGAYAAAGKLAVNLRKLATEVGRTEEAVGLKANELGLTDPGRRKTTRFPLKVIAFATDEEHRQAVGARMKQYIATHGHPRGMLGKTHTPEFAARMSVAARAMWNDPNSKLNSPESQQRRAANLRARHLAGEFDAVTTFSRCRRGFRDDIGIWVRSSWEANYARYLNTLMASHAIFWWEYESHRFVFPPVDGEPCSYVPDFRVWFCDGSHEWHEVKGWLTEKAATALRRMGECHPAEKVTVRDQAWFRGATRSGLASSIPNWEYPSKRNRPSSAA